MLRMRPEQVNAVVMPARLRFEIELYKFSMEHCSWWHQERTAEEAFRFIDASVDRAIADGFISELRVCQYYNLTIRLGLDFTASLSWARSVMTQTADLDESQRMARLFEAARSVLEPV